MAKRSNQEGSFYKDNARNRWCAIVPVPNEKPLIKKNKDKELVWNWYIETLAEVKKGRVMRPNDWTVDAWSATWIDEYIKPSNIRTGSKEEYKRIIEAATESYKYSLLQAVTPDQIQRHLLQRAGSGKADSTIKKDLIIVSKMFRQAYLRRLIPFNPCDFVTLPKGSGIIRPPRVGTQKDILQFLKTASKDKNPITYPAILLLFSAAIRRSELLGLQWSDIDFKNKTISIQRSLQITKEKGLIIEKPKTAAGYREIAVGIDVIAALQKLKSERNNPPFVFTTEAGTVYHPRNFSRIFAGIEKQSEVSISLHGARHSTATILAEANISGSDLAGFLGHSSAAFSMTRYVHPSKKANKKLEKTISTALAKMGSKMGSNKKGS